MAGLSKSAQAATLLRILANRAGYDISRDHFRHRVVYALEQAGVDCVLDIGANVGQFGVQLRRAGFRGHIHSVEPLRHAFAQLEHRGASDARWSAQRAAASDTVGTVDINVAENSVSSSVLPMLDRHRQAAPTAGYIGTEQVPCTTVDAIVAAYELRPERTMLKIDVQGYEQAVLDGAQRTLSEFGAVRMELSLAELYEGQKLMPDMVQYLVSLGLELWHIEPGFSDPVSGRLLQFDGVFIRAISA